MSNGNALRTAHATAFCTPVRPPNIAAAKVACRGIIVLAREDPEIYAFLDSSRLEEPINRFRSTAVFHGHAHNGMTDGKTSTDIPVYNVSAPALHKTGKPFRIVEL
jgi:hypothetical protein